MTDGKIGDNSYVSLGLFIGAIGVTVSATFWISNILAKVDKSLDHLDTRMTKIEERQARPDPWSGSDMYRWVTAFEKLNPTIKTPEPKHYAIQ